MSQANPSEQEINIYAKEWLGNGNKIKAAWKMVFPASKATEKSKDEKASLLHGLAKVQSRISQLREVAAEKADEVYGITAESLLAEYEEARVKALEAGQISASVSAITGKVKLCGFDVSKIELSGIDGTPIKTESIFNFIPVGNKH